MVGELMMPFLKHLEELKRRLTICIITFLVVFGIVYTLSIRTTQVGDVTVPYLYPDFYNNIPAQLFDQFRADLLPNDIELLNIGGIDALVVDVKIAMFLAFALSMPVFAWQVARFITPALYPHERRFVAKVVVPASLMFALGGLFSYFFFTPIALNFFFTYGEELGVAKTMGVTNFLSWITMLVLAFGIIFELPIFMAALTKLGIVSAKRWLSGWRYAVVGFLIVGGIITPDVSGVTQVFVALPMTGLYLGGVAWAMYIERKRDREEEV